MDSGEWTQTSVVKLLLKAAKPEVNINARDEFGSCGGELAAAASSTWKMLK